MTRHSIKPSEFSDCDPALPRTQYGALCWRMHRDRVEVLLITSRDTGRWVIPKGWPMAGLPPEAAAAREAWEEAGVEGAIEARCAGLYTYQKVMPKTDAVPCAVEVYGLRVARLSAQFPERKERRRKWFTVAKAARKVWEPELRSLMLGFVPPKPAAKGAAKRKATAGDAIRVPDVGALLLDHDRQTTAILAGWQMPDTPLPDAALPDAVLADAVLHDDADGSHTIAADNP